MAAEIARTGSGSSGPRWYQLLLAAALLVALLALAGAVLYWGLNAEPTDWRAGLHARLFLVVALAGAGVGLVALAAVLIRRANAARTAPATDTADPAVALAAAPDAGPAPSGLRLLGLLLLFLLVLLTGWLALAAEQQHALMLNLLYPASFGVALVLLFDKASRRWGQKSAAAGLREWLYCDLLALLLLLGYINLLRADTGTADPGYAGFFWDLLHISAFFVVFWLLDRRAGRYRFLLTQLYLGLLPLLLLLWHNAHDSAAWDWASAWPFCLLALVFLLLEVIALLAARDAENRALTTLKDVLFVVLYVAFMLAARSTPPPPPAA